MLERVKRNSRACKQKIDQSQLGNRARNSQRIEMVSIKQFSCTTRQKLGNSRCQREATLLSNKVTRQSCSTLLLHVWHGPYKEHLHISVILTQLYSMNEYKYECKVTDRPWLQAVDTKTKDAQEQQNRQQPAIPDWIHVDLQYQNYTRDVTNLKYDMIRIQRV